MSNDTDLLREVEEDIRRERMEKLWAKYATPAIAALVVAVGVIFALVYFEQQRVARNEAAAEQLYQTILLASNAAGPQREQGLAQLETLVNEAPEGASLMAAFYRAALLASRDGQEEAQALLTGIAAEGGVARLYRDVAALSAARLALQRDLPDEAEVLVAEMSEDHAELAALARETLALASLAAGDEATARERLQSLIDDPATPGAVVLRAQRLLEAQGERQSLPPEDLVIAPTPTPAQDSIILEIPGSEGSGSQEINLFGEGQAPQGDAAPTSEPEAAPAETPTVEAATPGEAPTTEAAAPEATVDAAEAEATETSEATAEDSEADSDAAQATSEPTEEPLPTAAVEVEEPTAEEAPEATATAATAPTADSTPAADPTAEATAEPTPEAAPTGEAQPSVEPTAESTAASEPAAAPSQAPSPAPSPEETAE